jgi:hypothetical protein
MPTPKTVRILGLLLIALIMTGFVIGWLFPAVTLMNGRIIWILEMLLLLVFALIAGKATTGVWRAVLIDANNKISLSRLQMFIWTILLLSGYVTAVLLNIRGKHSDPLSIALAPTLWGLMGISTASLVGSPLIKNAKKDQPTNQRAKAETVRLLQSQGVNETSIKAEGQLLVKENPDNASWTDLFKGEEVGNAAHLDLGKIQMFYFTLIIWFAYATSLASSFNPMAKIVEFPQVSEGMVALLAISHAGYLTNLAVPHTSRT